MSSSRRFSQAISEGDGISLIAEVDSADAARRAESDGAEAVLVYSGLERQLESIRGATPLPILFFWDGENTNALSDADACVISVPDWQGGVGFGDALENAHFALRDDFELAFRIDDDEQLAESLERYEPEIFVLTASRSEDDEAVEHVLDLLADVPAGKLAIAEVAVASREDVEALERAGFDGVIVGPRQVAAVAGAAPPEV